MTTELRENAAREVLCWRRDQLARAGFTLRVAARLARDERYDLHALLELVQRGCPPEVAACIVAPLEAQETAA